MKRLSRLMKIGSFTFGDRVQVKDRYDSSDIETGTVVTVSIGDSGSLVVVQYDSDNRKHTVDLDTVTKI